MQNNQENQPVKENLSVNALRAFVGVFGVLFLSLIAIDLHDATPLCFLPFLVIVMWSVDDKVADDVNNTENWDDTEGSI